MKNDNQLFRRLIQIIILFIVLSIGIDFYRFVKYCETGGAFSFIERPPGVEAFLPISSLISLKYYFLSGEINPIHPAGLIIFVAILVISILFKRSFCGWMCPFGFLSEMLWKTGEKIFGKNLKFPVWLDSILRSIKYLILLFFIWAIVINMDGTALREFIYSPYNRIADIKMLKFFTDIFLLTIIVLSILIVMSGLVKNFWCRYLCPYGALLGFCGLFSPFKIMRNERNCTGCKKCTRECPSHITVHKQKRIHSDECMACLRCVDVFPVKNTLNFKLKKRRIKLTGYALILLLLIIYASFVGIGMITGNWENSITVHEYVERTQDLDNLVYDHNRGKVVTDESDY